jgi:hypothetical protein
LRATVVLCAAQPSCWYHICIRFLSGMPSKRRGRMFNKNAAYLSTFRFPSIKWVPIIRFSITPYHMFTLHWHWCSAYRSHRGFSAAQ